MGLLNAMRQHSSDGLDAAHANETKWSLPPPNSYTYSLVVAACARAKQSAVALALLDQMEETMTRERSGDAAREGVATKDAVWVYNAALLAFVEPLPPSSSAESSSDKHKGEDDDMPPVAAAFDVLAKMESSKGDSAVPAPDTVSYNTVLSALNENSFDAWQHWCSRSLRLTELRGSFTSSKHERLVEMVAGILDSMRARGVSRDAITYSNAIAACKSKHSSEDALKIFRNCMSDAEFVRNASRQHNDPGEPLNAGAGDNGGMRPLTGRATTGVVFAANAALSAAASSGDMHATSEILSLLSSNAETSGNDNSHRLNAESVKHILRTLGAVRDSGAVLLLLGAIGALADRDAGDNNLLRQRHSLDVLHPAISPSGLPMIREDVYGTALLCCLKNDELDMADEVLRSMKEYGLPPGQQTLQVIIAEYCRMALSESREEFQIARQMAKRWKQKLPHQAYSTLKPIYVISRKRAQAAVDLLRAVDTPYQTPALQGAVTEACCAAALWQDARSVLRRMHRAALREVKRQMQEPQHQELPFLRKLPRLHRSLLKTCAKAGDIMPALNFADDIQFLASRIRRQHRIKKQQQHKHQGQPENKQIKIDNEPEVISLSSHLLMDVPNPDDAPKVDFSDSGALSPLLERPVGLTGQDWKLILIAASRGGHWKVCVGEVSSVAIIITVLKPSSGSSFLYFYDRHSALSPPLRERDTSNACSGVLGLRHRRSIRSPLPCLSSPKVRKDCPCPHCCCALFRGPLAVRLGDTRNRRLD